MSTRRAVVHKSDGVAEVKEVPLPKLRDDYIIVKTKAVALNPTDWKGLQSNSSPGAIVGCDYSGIVEEIGSKVTNSFKVGDKVAGFIRGNDGSNHDNGAFADRVTAKGTLSMKVADSISFEDAATLGVGITTVGQGLYQNLGLPLLPAKVAEPAWILIYGGSTATGSLAIQFAKLSGLKVVSTSSPHNFDLLKKLGADKVFDYKEPGVGAKIREATGDNLKLVFDTFSEGTSPEISAAAISSKGGKYGSILIVDKFPRNDVRNTWTLAYTALGEDFNNQYPANQADAEFGARFWAASVDLINSGKIKPHPSHVGSGGLEGILQGLKDLKDGKVSGVKLVYKID